MPGEDAHHVLKEGGGRDLDVHHRLLGPGGGRDVALDVDAAHQAHGGAALAVGGAEGAEVVPTNQAGGSRFSIAAMSSGCATCQ